MRRIDRISRVAAKEVTMCSEFVEVEKSTFRIALQKNPKKANRKETNELTN